MDRQNNTLKWYEENAEELVARTSNVDMTELYRAFLAQVPAGGSILDLGCGAGKAAQFFVQSGYSVLGVDGCAALCEHTRRSVGCPVRCLRFEELDYEAVFDGVWACASLLHVRKADLPRILRLVRRAMKPDAVFYASFKYGEIERERNGRVFSDFTEASIRTLLEEAGGFQELALWTTNDTRPGRADERWLNALYRAATPGTV